MKGVNLMERESFLFYRSYLEAIGKIKSIEAKYKLLMGIINYGLDRTEPEFDDELSQMAWVFIEPLLDANYRKYLAGQKGGAPAGNQNAKRSNQKQPKTTTNNQKQGNVNVKDNVTANDNAKANANANDNVNVNIGRNPYVDINTMTITDFDKYDEWNEAHGIVEG